MDDLQRLIATDDIRQLKARYWIGIDTKNPDMLRACFTDDAVIDFRSEFFAPDEFPLTTPTPDQFCAGVMKSLEGAISAHHGHHWDVKFNSATEGEATWAMEDNFWFEGSSGNVSGANKHKGYGLYYDRYSKVNGDWLISATSLKRQSLVKE